MNNIPDEIDGIEIYTFRRATFSKGAYMDFYHRYKNLSVRYLFTDEVCLSEVLENLPKAKKAIEDYIEGSDDLANNTVFKDAKLDDEV